jgi:hypothetical protein
MKKKMLILVLSIALMVFLTASSMAQEWSVKGNYTESCSCNPACPCVFGSPPTLGHCDASGLLEIKEGHYGDVNLDGITVLQTGSLGVWMMYYLSENATDEQVKAVEPLMSALFGFGDMEILAIEKTPISIERSEEKVKFSGPVSTVEIELMKGKDGKPIKVQNLPAPYLTELMLYKSITNSHKSKDKEFSYSGTNGLATTVDASSDK